MGALILEREILDNIFVLNDKLINLTEYIKTNLFGLDLICDYESEEALREDLLNNPLLDFIIEDIRSIKYKKDLKNLILNDEIFDHIKENNVFLINCHTDKLTDLREKFCYHFYNSDTLLEFEKILDEVKNTQILKVTKDTTIPKELIFNNWIHISPCFSKMNSLIIFDKYILKETDLCKLKDNIFKIISEIGKSKFKINLMIITDFLDNVEMNKKYDLVNNYIKEKEYNITMTLVNHSKSFYPRDFEGFHSRFMLSNYFYIISTDSFNFFKPNGKVINSCELIINCNLIKNNRTLFKKEIKSLNDYLSRINNNPTNPSDKLKLMYKNHKTNPLLS